ncbi:HepT-like ribonuclease domain-containing protein [Fervidobacterium sp.]
MRSPQERLLDILEAIARIERYVALGKVRFLEDELIQVWMVHHLQRIGEAAARLGREFHEAHPQVPWREMVAMRNLLAHEYFSVDLEEVWETAVRDLPLLKAQIQTLLERP